jgi:ubiquinone/menaquinone biosynthesis C-methylase UbiE
MPNMDKKIIDVGCGKGRFLTNLLEDIKGTEFYAVDISDKVMGTLSEKIEKKNGVLTQIPYADNTFDITYAVESLEHAIFPENAIKEMLRVTKDGGKVIVVDKSAKALGMLEIDAWEQWFDDEIFENAIKGTGSSLKVIDKIPYDGYEADGLFKAWIITK